MRVLPTVKTKTSKLGTKTRFLFTTLSVGPFQNCIEFWRRLAVLLFFRVFFIILGTGFGKELGSNL